MRDQDENGRVMAFEYQRSELLRYTLHRDGDALVPERIEPDLEDAFSRILESESEESEE